MLHRPWLVYYMPQLLVIDGIPISEDERAKSELYFLDQQVVSFLTMRDKYHTLISCY